MKTITLDWSINKLFFPVRLAAVPTPSYGMVQVMSENNTWMSVCDTGFDDVDAKIICRNIGYKDGKAQCCSSLGQKLVNYNPIGNTHHYLPYLP